MKRSRQSLILLVAVACMLTCGTTATPTNDPLVIALSLTGSTIETDLEGVVGLRGQASRIEVFHRTVAADPTTETIRTPFNGVLPFAVLLPRPNTPVPIAVLDLPAGFVREVRIFVDSLAGVKEDGSELPLPVPGGSLKIVLPQLLQVSPGAESDLLIRIAPGQIVGNACGLPGLTTAVLPAIPTQPIDVFAGVPADHLNLYFLANTPSNTIASVVAGYDSRAAIVHRFPMGLVSVRLPPDRLLSGAIDYFRAQASVDLVSARPAVAFHAPAPPNDLNTTYLPYFESATYEAHQITMGNPQPTVAIIDSGFELDHPDLAVNVWINAGELPAGMQVGESPGAGADFDADGIVTFRDLNMPGHESFLASFGIGKQQGDPNVVDARDLLAALSDRTDGDNNTFIDDLVGWNFQAGNNDPTPPVNTNLVRDPMTGQQIINFDAHGRGVAGVVAAVINNSFGTTGVAPLARLVPLRVCTREFGCDPGHEENALAYAAMMGLDIANVSIGSLNYKTDTALSNAAGPDWFQRVAACGAEPVQTLNGFGGVLASSDALWKKFASSELLIVRSAGNCSAFLSASTRSQIFEDGLGVPNVNNIISVTRIGELFAPQVLSGVRASSVPLSGGNRGADVTDIAAPGTGVQIVGQRDFQNGVYGADGTSIAAPFVAGAAALVLSRDPSLRGHPDQLRARLMANADKNAINPADGKSGTELVKDGNRLNVCQAVAGGQCPFPPFARPTTTPDAGVQDAGCDASPTCPEGQIFNAELCRCQVVPA